MIDNLLKSGVSPQKIVFVSMDHPMLKLSDFNEILDCYHENIYANQDAYYFFDEVQYAQDWDKWLKTIYDMQPDKKSFIRCFYFTALKRKSTASAKPFSTGWLPPFKK